jgi:lipoprotein-releasing system permease protein
MLKVFLWLRYLHKKKIVFLSIAAVAVSTALLIVVSNLFNGFINAFEGAATEMLGDVVIAPPVKFTGYAELVEQLEHDPDIEAATATLSVPGLLNLGGGNVRAVMISGIEPASKAAVTGFKSSLLRQKKSAGAPSFALPGAGEGIGGFVGIGVIAEPDEKTDEYDFTAVEKMIGQQVVITTGAAGNGAERFRRKVIKFTVSDIVFTGAYYLDKTFIYLPIEAVQKAVQPGEDGRVADQIQIKLADGVTPQASLERIRQIWGLFAKQHLKWNDLLIEQTGIATSKQMQAQYVAEFRKQMDILMLIFGVVSLSVVMLIFCIFYMIVVTRLKDIAIIKSCGATNFSAGVIFLGFGGCVGIGGGILGTIIAAIITRNINVIEGWIRILFGLKLWKSSTYMFNKIPNEMDWSAAMPILIFAVIAAALGALVPAIIAARTRPVEVLRYE